MRGGRRVPPFPLLMSTLLDRVHASVLFAVALASAGACQSEIADVPESECASGRKWVGGNQGSSRMHPGRNCKECHDFKVAGTVYPEGGLHDADDCLGIEGVSVLVEDATGRMVSLETNEAGNFYLGRGNSMEFPLRLRAEQGDALREMTMAAETGACASCHTSAGKNGAAGRIIMP